jgi:hypothetical protein
MLPSCCRLNAAKRRLWARELPGQAAGHPKRIMEATGRCRSVGSGTANFTRNRLREVSQSITSRRDSRLQRSGQRDRKRTSTRAIPTRSDDHF